MLMGGTGLGAAVNRLLKEIVARPRPSQLLVHVSAGDHLESFPSGHVVFYIEFFGFVLFLGYALARGGLIRSGVISFCGAAITVIGVSRVYLGAHWPSDVVGAYLSGGVWLFIVIESYRRLKTRRDSVRT